MLPNLLNKVQNYCSGRFVGRVGPSALLRIHFDEWIRMTNWEGGRVRRKDGSLITNVGDDGGAGKTRAEDEVRRIGVVGKSLRMADNTANFLCGLRKFCQDGCPNSLGGFNHLATVYLGWLKEVIRIACGHAKRG